MYAWNGIFFLTKVPITSQCDPVKGLHGLKLYLKRYFMKTGNKKKNQKKIQIKGKMPLSIQFFRDEEADAIHIQRCQLDRATLLACAVKRLREEQGNRSSSGQEPSA